MRGPLTKERRASLDGQLSGLDARTLDALPIHVAVVDRNGTIRAANLLWKDQPLKTFCQNAELGEGADFLQACELAARQETAGADAIVQGLRQVLAGQRETFSIEFAVHGSRPERWFKLIASSTQYEGCTAAVVAQVEIARQKPVDEERDRLFEQSLGLMCIIGFDGFL